MSFFITWTSFEEEGMYDYWKFLKLLNISHIQLPVVRGKVTGMDSILETSSPLGDEPANPTEKLFKQLSLFDLSEWSAG